MKLFETRMEDNETAAMLAWQADVERAFPAIASKLKLKARVEHGVNTISAEVAGQDRCYGVFDVKSGTGVILGD